MTFLAQNLLGLSDGLGVHIEMCIISVSMVYYIAQKDIVVSI